MLTKNKASVLAHGSHHVQAAIASFKRLFLRPLSCITTIIVIGVAWMLPTGLLVVMGNIQQLTNSWQNNAQISIYLKKDTTNSAIEALQKTLKANEAIKSVQYISPAEGLKTFSAQSGFDQAMEQLKKNPLPPVLIINPTLNGQSPKTLNALFKKLEALPEADLVKMDSAWIERLYHMISLGKRIAFALAGLLSLGVLFIVANTIYLSSQEQRKEIEIYKLVGATKGFIRRPFLYAGIWYGFFGAVVAWGLVSLFVLFLRAPVEKLTLLYQSQFELHGLGTGAVFILLVVSMGLGLLASLVGVHRELRF